MTYRAFQCSAFAMNIACPEDQTILITEANYGQYGYTSTQDDLACKPPHPQEDCTEGMEGNFPAEWVVLKELCDGENSCSFTAQFAVMTTCGEPSSSDYIDVVYQCLPG